MSLKLEYIYVLIIALFLGACTTTPVDDSSQTSPHSRQPDKYKTAPTPELQPETVADRHSAGEKAPEVATADTNRQTDIWKRIRQNLALERDLSHSRVRAQVAFYAKKQEFLDRMAERATPYIYYIVEELEKRNMPMDLALLPVVESAYQPFAYSPSHASGIWQFIPSTGRHYGLKQNWWYDGRRDIIASTDAALTYLQKLHNDFDGDWLLAVAAYNAGERTVERAIQRNLKSGKPADFWSLKLRRETMHYVPSLLAVAEIVAHPENYDVALIPVPNEPYFDVIDIGSQVDLGVVSELTGMSNDELHTLNPGIKKWATDPEGPYHLLIPLDKSTGLEQKLAALPASERVRWQVYHIKQGDTLGRIAQLYQTDVSALKQANRLNSNLIRAGHTLLIPTSYTPAASRDTDRAGKVTGLQYAVAEQQVSGKPFEYTIMQGDTLWNISRQFGVGIDDLCRWNGIQRNSIITPGKTLQVRMPQREGIIPAVANTNLPESRHISYTVQSGDSLWLIARRFDVTVEQIQHWNSMNKKTALKPGQNLDIYIGQAPADV